VSSTILISSTILSTWPLPCCYSCGPPIPLPPFYIRANCPTCCYFALCQLFNYQFPTECLIVDSRYNNSAFIFTALHRTPLVEVPVYAISDGILHPTLCLLCNVILLFYVNYETMVRSLLLTSCSQTKCVGRQGRTSRRSLRALPPSSLSAGRFVPAMTRTLHLDDSTKRIHQGRFPSNRSSKR